MSFIKGQKIWKSIQNLVIFKEMGYNSDLPEINVAIMKQNMMWFSHYIFGESMKDFSVL